MSLLDLFRRRGPLDDIEERVEKLVKIIKEQRKLMATQADLANEIIAKTTQIRKAIDEINAALQALRDAVANAPANEALTAAVAALGVAVQAADDIVPDAPPTP